MKSLQVATSPCCHLDLPDVIPANLSSDASSPTTAVSRSAFTCFFLRVIGLPQVNSRSASSVDSTYTTSHGERFRGYRYFLMLRPLSLLASQVVPTAAYTTAGQLRLLHPGRTRFVTSARTGYANRPNQVIDGAGTFTPPDSQPCRPLRSLTFVSLTLT